MASSVVAAFLDRYNDTPAPLFPGAARWPLSFDGVPVVTGAGAQLRVPFADLKDQGTAAGYDAELNVFEETTLTLTLYANSLGDCDAAAEAVKYGGLPINAGGGLDFGPLPTLAVPTQTLQVHRFSERRFVAGEDPANNRVHALELKYRVTLVRKA